MIKWFLTEIQRSCFLCHHNFQRFLPLSSYKYLIQHSISTGYVCEYLHFSFVNKCSECDSSTLNLRRKTTTNPRFVVSSRCSPLLISHSLLQPDLENCLLFQRGVSPLELWNILSGRGPTRIIQSNSCPARTPQNPIWSCPKAPGARAGLGAQKALRARGKSGTIPSLDPSQLCTTQE